MDEGLKQARWTSFTILVGLAASMLFVGVLEHYGIMPPHSSLGGTVVQTQEMPKPGVVAIEQEFKKWFEGVPTEDVWEGTFIIARVYPERRPGEQFVVVRDMGNGRSIPMYRAVFAPSSILFREGQLVEFGTIKFRAANSAGIVGEEYFVRPKQ